MSERTIQPGQGKRQRCRGASLIEFVIVMGLMFLLLFGVMEFGFMMSTAMTVNAAAQQGARAAALGKNSTTAVNNGLTGLKSSGTAGQPGYRTVTVEYAPNGSTSWSTTVPNPLTSNYQVRATVTYNYKTLTFVGDSLPGTTNGIRTLTGQAVMRYGG
jgi:Flp pilus assembly protein TadG